jgi:hypothetical protein
MHSATCAKGLSRLGASAFQKEALLDERMQKCAAMLMANTLHILGVPNMKIMKPKREGKHSKHRAKKSSKIKIRCIEVNTASTAH